MDNKYQLFDRLHPDEYAALEADIDKRGVMVPVEVDENGETLDGHHRIEIAERLGKPYKTIVRKFKSEAEKREHVIKLNLCRRHLDPLRWGQAFLKLLKERGVKRGRGANQGEHSATVAESPSREPVAHVKQVETVPDLFALADVEAFVQGSDTETN